MKKTLLFLLSSFCSWMLLARLSFKNELKNYINANIRQNDSGLITGSR